MAELNLGHVVGPGVPTGGTSGQILKKNSSTNFDTSWSANDATTIPMSSSDSTSINQVISNLNTSTGKNVSGTDLATLKTNLLTYASSMEKYEKRILRITAGFGDDNFNLYGVYNGEIYCIDKSSNTATYFTALVSDQFGNTVSIGYANGTWDFKSFKATNQVIVGQSVSGVDANNLITTGRYLLNGNIANLPYGNYGYLDVIASSSNVVQYYSNLNAVSLYVRNKYSGTWSDWQELALNSNLQKVSYASVVTDFNSCIETGVYCGNSASNSPITGWVILSVTRLADNNNWIVQNAHDTNNNRYFVRSRDNGTWRDWQELARNSKTMVLSGSLSDKNASILGHGISFFWVGNVGYLCGWMNLAAGTYTSGTALFTIDKTVTYKAFPEIYDNQTGDHYANLVIEGNKIKFDQPSSFTLASNKYVYIEQCVFAV